MAPSTLLVMGPQAPPEPAGAAGAGAGGARPAPPAADRTVRVVVRLEDEPLEVTTDRERTAALVTSIYHLLDRSNLWVIAERLRAAVPAEPAPLGSPRLPLTGGLVTTMGAVSAVRTDAGQVADLWEDEVRRLDARISRWLIEAEDRATAIALGRLRASREAVVKERDRYLTGLPPADPQSRQLPLRGGRLSAEGTDRLRTFLREAAELRTRARAQLTEFQQLTQRTVPPREEVLKARHAVLERVAVVHRYIAEAARDSPLLYWLVDWDADPVVDLDRPAGPDAVLYHRVATVLRRCWVSSWVVQDRVPAGPARATATSDSGVPEERVGDTIDDEDEGGPWRFPPVIQQAVDELGWAGPTPQATAVKRVMAAAGGPWNQSLAFAAASAAVVVAAHVFVPPVAVAVDVVIGAVDLLATMATHAERMEEYTAVIDQRQALVDRPSGQDVAAAMVGMLVGPLDGAAGLLANLIPVAISTWTPTAEETRL